MRLSPSPALLLAALGICPALQAAEYSYKSDLRDELHTLDSNYSSEAKRQEAAERVGDYFLHHQHEVKYDADFLRDVVGSLKDPDLKVRKKLTRMLGYAEPIEEAAEKVIREALFETGKQDPDPENRRNAIHSLDSLISCTHNCGPVIDFYAERLKDEQNQRTREEVSWALLISPGKSDFFGGPEVRTALHERKEKFFPVLRNDSSRYVRGATAKALAEAGIKIPEDDLHAAYIKVMGTPNSLYNDHGGRWFSEAVDELEIDEETRDQWSAEAHELWKRLYEIQRKNRYKVTPSDEEDEGKAVLQPGMEHFVWNAERMYSHPQQFIPEKDRAVASAETLPGRWELIGTFPNLRDREVGEDVDPQGIFRLDITRADNNELAVNAPAPEAENSRPKKKEAEAEAAEPAKSDKSKRAVAGGISFLDYSFKDAPPVGLMFGQIKDDMYSFRSRLLDSNHMIVEMAKHAIGIQINEPKKLYLYYQRVPETIAAANTSGKMSDW